MDATTYAPFITAAGVLFSGIISSLIAVYGFRHTGKITISTKTLELQHSGRVKIAEARVEWIERFREDAAELYGVLSQIARLQAVKTVPVETSYTSAIQRRELYVKSSKLKSKLLMRLDPNSTEPAEVELEKLLRKAAPRDTDEAAKYRRLFRSNTRTVLNAEWKKAKSEINRTL